MSLNYYYELKRVRIYKNNIGLPVPEDVSTASPRNTDYNQ